MGQGHETDMKLMIRQVHKYLQHVVKKMCAWREGYRAKFIHPFINILGSLLCARLGSVTGHRSASKANKVSGR